MIGGKRLRKSPSTPPRFLFDGLLLAKAIHSLPLTSVSQNMVQVRAQRVSGIVPANILGGCIIEQHASSCLARGRNQHRFASDGRNQPGKVSIAGQQFKQASFRLSRTRGSIGRSGSNLPAWQKSKAALGLLVGRKYRAHTQIRRHMSILPRSILTWRLIHEPPRLSADIA